MKSLTIPVMPWSWPFGWIGFFLTTAHIHPWPSFEWKVLSSKYSITSVSFPKARLMESAHHCKEVVVRGLLQWSPASWGKAFGTQWHLLAYVHPSTHFVEISCGTMDGRGQRLLKMLVEKSFCGQFLLLDEELVVLLLDVVLLFLFSDERSIVLLF